MGVYGESVYFKLLDGVTGASDGVWKSVDGLNKMTVHVEGINGDTVTINGSNNAIKPADSDAEIILATLTSDDIKSIDAPISWVKTATTVAGSGTISSHLKGTPS